MVLELCDLLKTSAAGKGILSLQDALILSVQALCCLADEGHVAALYGGQILSEDQLDRLKGSLQNALLKVNCCVAVPIIF